MNKFFLLFYIFSLISCNPHQQRGIKNTVEKWSGREVVFPDSVTLLANGIIPTNACLYETEYKIISYIDTTECLKCKLHLPKWKTFLNDLKENNGVDISFFFVVQPELEDEMAFYIKRDNFNYPVCIDINYIIDNLNQFPQEFVFQTFLLDRYNRVLVIGNPIHNETIRKLYEDVIVQKPKAKVPFTTCTIDNTNLSFGKMFLGDSVSKSFAITNTGNTPLVIFDVITSCDCINVKYDKTPIPVGKTKTITIGYKAKEEFDIYEDIQIKYNGEKGSITIKVTGKVVSKVN